MVTAKSNLNLYQSVLTLITGVVFLGTPHRGSPAQPLGYLVAKCAKALGYGEVGNFDNLREDSEALFELVDQFAKIVRERSISVKCFFESYRTDLRRRVFFPLSVVSPRSLEILV